MARLVPFAELPALSVGELLETKGKTQLYSSPVRDPHRGNEKLLGVLPKKALVTSAGAMAGNLGKMWIKVLTPLGLGWMRLKNLKCSPVVACVG